MAAAPATAKDGFDQALRACSRPTCAATGPGAVAKQGWMCCFSGQYYLHSAGAVGPEKRFLVVLLTRQPRTKGWPAARAELTGIATQAVAALRLTPSLSVVCANLDGMTGWRTVGAR